MHDGGEVQAFDVGDGGGGGFDVGAGGCDGGGEAGVVFPGDLRGFVSVMLC